MKAGHIGAVSLVLCAAAGAAMFALSGGKKAEYCSLGEYHGRVAALSGGIVVYSREELYARLEDFGS